MNLEKIKIPDYPDYPPDYKPNIVEIHDDLGLLVRIEAGELCHESQRVENFMPQILIWLFDGTDSENVAYVHTAHTVLVNRINNLNAINDINETLGIGA